MNTPDNIEAVVSKYCKSFPDTLRSLAQLVDQACRHGDLDRPLLRDAIHACHRIGGTAHCMGFRYVGSVFMRLEVDLENVHGVRPSEVPEQIRQIEQKLSNLHGLMSYVAPENSLLLKKMGRDEEVDSKTRKRVETILANQRIIIADDDASVRNLVFSSLQNAGVKEIKPAASGKEVIKLAHEFRPTMVIADWMMEPMDGLELLQKVRAGETSMNYDMPLVFISALNRTRGIFKVIRNGADYFLLKPFTQNSLIKGITEVAVRS